MGADLFQVGAFVQTVYRHAGKQGLFEIVARCGDTVWIENCHTVHQMPVTVRELHDPGSWLLAREAPSMLVEVPDPFMGLY